MKIAEIDHEVTEFCFILYFIYQFKCLVKDFLKFFFFFIKIVSINIQMFLKSSFYL